MRCGCSLIRSRDDPVAVSQELTGHATSAYRSYLGVGVPGAALPGRPPVCSSRTRCGARGRSTQRFTHTVTTRLPAREGAKVPARVLRSPASAARSGHLGRLGGNAAHRDEARPTSTPRAGQLADFTGWMLTSGATATRKPLRRLRCRGSMMPSECNSIGVTGFEPATSCSRSRRSTGLSYTPNSVSLFFPACARRESNSQPSDP